MIHEIIVALYIIYSLFLSVLFDFYFDSSRVNRHFNFYLKTINKLYHGSAGPSDRFCTPGWSTIFTYVWLKAQYRYSMIRNVSDNKLAIIVIQIFFKSFDRCIINIIYDENKYHIIFGLSIISYAHLGFNKW